MTTPALFRELGPEYAALSDGTIESWLTRAGLRVDADFHETFRADAVALLALHLYTMAQPTSSGGFAGAGAAPRRLRARNWEKEFATTGSSGGGRSYEQTSYGRAYLELLHDVGMGAPRGAFPSTVVSV